MADITFTCPHCNQPVQCDDAWGGQQIQCPICQGQLIVPPSAPASPPPATGLGKQLVAPPSGPAPKLAFQQNAQQPAVTNRSVPIRNLAPPPPKKKSPLIKILVWTGVVGALGAGVYFAWPLVQDWQEKSNAKRREAEKNSDGGQVGHIANLYDVLDKTDPSNPRLDEIGKKGDSRATGPRQRDSGAAKAIPIPADGAAPGGAATAQPDLPVVPPVWTLDVTEAKIPQGRVNGMISSSNFVAETARVDAVGPAQVLRLFQGDAMAPDREILVYLNLKAGDKLSGHSWTIASDKKGTDVPRVIKRWKVKAGYPLFTKMYGSGYAMKLELGQVADGAITGKVFVALPDPEQTVVGGVFKATTSLVDVIPAAATTGVAPGPTTASPAPAPADASAYQRRYGGRK